jgi:poly(3-hydroxybutyrate) depolymerase
MEKALRLVEPRLRACSRLADGLLLVEFATDGSDRFAAITPVAETDPALLQCVRRATKTIRFAPTHRPNFIEEYRP